MKGRQMIDIDNDYYDFVARRYKLLIVVTFTLLLMCKSLFGYTLYVHPNGNGGAYQTIQEAIDHALDDQNPDNLTSPSVVIKVADSTTGYLENLDLSFTHENGVHLVSDITIESISDNPENCILTAALASYPVLLINGHNNSSLRIRGMSIRHIDLTGTTLRKGVWLTFPTGQNCQFDALEIRNCIFVNNHEDIKIDSGYNRINNFSIIDNTFNYFQYYYSEPVCIDAGIAGNGSEAVILRNRFIRHNPNNHITKAITLGRTFNNVVLEDNLFYYTDVETHQEGGNQNLIIQRNEFLGAKLRLGANHGTWEIYQNKFIGLSNPSNFNAIIMSGKTYETECFISKNLFVNAYLPIMIKLGHPDYQGRINAFIESNSFENCDSILWLQRNTNYPISNSVPIFRNNLYTGSSSSNFSIVDQYNNPLILEGDNRISISYSHFSQILDTNPSLIIDNSTVSYGDPLINIDNTDFSYSLIWTQGEKSPCINTGYGGVNNELTDPDGTPPDIGALYYPHSAKTYSFERNDGQYIYWMSFPVVDDRTKNDAIYWNELQHLFDSHTDYESPQLDRIEWFYKGDDRTMVYDSYEQEWSHKDYQATQPKGFKVQFHNMQISPITVYGFKADPAITPIEVMPLANNLPIENWIGYFVPYTQKVMDAFSRTLPGTNKTYLDHIYSIKTQRWCINRVAYEYESSWAIPPDTYTLSEGDMVAILLLPNAPNELFWSALSVATPVIRPEPQFFSYTEKLDYTPVFIEFDPTDLPSEVGIFVNGVCMGASVVDTTIVDVCFYLEDSKSDDDIEINFYYEGKGKRKAEGFTVYNPHRQIFEKKTLSTGIIDKSIFISYSKGDGVPNAPMHTSLSPNYPNPFNPQTTISFTLGKAMPAKVEIYNVKGQRVKTLVDDKLPIGRHQYIWNGRDNNQQSVASGVYFARLKTTEGTHVQKMMLLK